MVTVLRALLRGATYSRLLHMWVPWLPFSIWIFIYPDAPWVPALVLLPLGLIPSVRKVEGVQAQLMLTPGEREPGISQKPSATWQDRLRTVLWLLVRMVLMVLAGYATVWPFFLAYLLGESATGPMPEELPFLEDAQPHWAYALLVPLPLLAAGPLIVGLGALVTAAARRLLGPSPAERLATLEARTEQLLERTRIARELHDSIGHALTIAVVQAGAARAAADPAFTDRALEAIEETGRTALEDLDRVLGILREPERPVSSRPTLVDAGRLLESARASGVKLDAEVTGPVDTVPGPVSREGYRILQESLTNALRHAGPVPVRARVGVADGTLLLEIRNPLDGEVPGPGRGSGLRGIRERAALLGGRARTGPDGGDWLVRAELPLG
ncbi:MULTISPECIES: sensor histidine kinase [unclassified Streptomyces]|uniref:sensor histidine kinase n=1 Tax=unclassified Streptomyces TaxID=2593676 RepID=UPI0007ED4CC1|nr:MULTISPECIES: histidine kinase [unclassified Streptomyces]MCP3768509.1 histidine kinase [Streptomyces sp. MAR25Y5]OBQ49728.1 two-component sensor histidine kinase [Streptomyces sp. H-KF8]